MVFNSLTFLVFFATVLLLHSLPLSWRAKKRNLLVASYLFYASWNPPYVLLLLTSTLVDWFAAAAMVRAKRGERRLGLLVLSLTVNFGLLASFKYAGFLLENFQALARMVGVEFAAAAPGLVLPVGISFYTFQSVSYSIDVYRGRAAPWPSFLDFALYVSFFPQLVAGPIVRSGTFLPQCLEPRRAGGDQIAWGFFLLALGLFEKAVLADSLLAPVADRVYASPDQAGFAAAWLGTLAFSGQILFDFSGYSTCAIGAALCLGFVLPENFDAPYAAIGFRDFWRRWHISLSTWLRDYVYISMGGNRRSRPRTHANVMATMLIGGLWHGASWNFVVWGGVHGALLSVERGLRSLAGGGLGSAAAVRAAAGLGTFLVVTMAWVPFRAADFAASLDLLSAMIGRTAGSMMLGADEVATVISVIAGLLIGQAALRHRSLDAIVDASPWWLLSTVLSVILIALATAPGENRAFIYFQF